MTDQRTFWSRTSINSSGNGKKVPTVKMIVWKNSKRVDKYNRFSLQGGKAKLQRYEVDIEYPSDSDEDHSGTKEEKKNKNHQGNTIHTQPMHPGTCACDSVPST